MRRADLFVALAHVQFTRNNYHNRFHLTSTLSLSRRWYTMSVNQSLEPLIAKRYLKPAEDWAAIKRRLPQYADVLADFDDLIGDRLVETNLSILRRTCEQLGIHTRITTDYASPLTATERLVDLCQNFNADTYLSGPSGKKYLDLELFEKAGIKVEFHDPVRPRAAVELLKEAA